MRKCYICQTAKPLEQFPSKYIKHRPDAKSSRCKKCANLIKHKRERAKPPRFTKEDAVKLLGGRCTGQSCLLNQTNDARLLDFHHRDPLTKSFDISSAIFKCTTKKAYLNLLKELDKCDLLCCVCHRLVHVQDRACGENHQAARSVPPSQRVLEGSDNES